jgi:hypothetical protein
MVFLLDILVCQGSIKLYLPDRPEEWALWLVIFNTPHIISGFITISNKNDISQYGGSFLKVITFLGVISLLVNGVFPSVISNENKYDYQILVFSVYGFFTLYHVFSQQFGISLILGQSAPSTKMNAFKWLSVVLSFLLFVHLGIGYRFEDYIDVIVFFEVVLSILLIVFGLDYLFKSKTIVGKLYHVGNILLVLSSCLFVNMGYGIFALIMPRFIHDLTAFLIYANHDGNRFLNDTQNHYIYFIFNKISVSPIYISALLGVLIAFLINALNPIVLVYFILIIDFFHYYVESKVWKSNSEHRKNLLIS